MQFKLKTTDFFCHQVIDERANTAKDKSHAAINERHGYGENNPKDPAEESCFLILGKKTSNCRYQKKRNKYHRHETVYNTHDLSDG